jgi:hypothetical protein
MNDTMRLAMQRAGLSSRVQPDYSPLPYQVGSHDGETYEDHDPDHVLVRAELLGWETELVCWIPSNAVPPKVVQQVRPTMRYHYEDGMERIGKRKATFAKSMQQSMKLKEAMKRPVWPSPNESKHRIGVGKGGLYATPSGKPPVKKDKPPINIYRLARLGREAQERMDKRNES